MKQLACGHLKMRIETYTEDYRWVVRCEECGSNETWTQREWLETLLVDESAEGPPLQIEPELEADSEFGLEDDPRPTLLSV